MKLAKGNMWGVWGHGMFIITTNATLKTNGRVVMGRGIAKEARERLTGVDLALGKRIKDTCGSGGVYRFLPLSPKFGVLQVKRNWYETADLGLIRAGVKDLIAYANNNPQMTFNLNFPGIGNGGLDRHLVLPIVEKLPDSVTVWEL